MHSLTQIPYVPGKAALHRTYEDQERLTSTSNDLLQKTRRAEKRKGISKTPQDYLIHIGLLSWLLLSPRQLICQRTANLQPSSSFRLTG